MTLCLLLAGSGSAEGLRRGLPCTLQQACRVLRLPEGLLREATAAKLAASFPQLRLGSRGIPSPAMPLQIVPPAALRLHAPPTRAACATPVFQVAPATKLVVIRCPTGASAACHAGTPCLASCAGD